MEILNISLTLITILFIVITIKLLVTAIQLKYLSNKILIAIFLIFIYAFIRISFIEGIQYYYNISLPFQSYNNTSLFFALPILFFLYTRTTLYDQKKFKLRDGYHALVFISFVFFFNLPFKNLYPNSIFTNSNELYWNIYFNTKIPLLLAISRIVLAVSYLIATYIMLKRYFKTKSESKQVNMVKRWLYTLTNSKLILSLFLIGFTTLFRTFFNDAHLAISLSKNIVALFLLALALYLYKNKQIMYNIPSYTNPNYQKINILKRTTDLQAVFKEANKSIIEKELFLKANFNLKGLSTTLHIKPKVLSLAISENGFENFSGYANHFKVNKAKSLIDEGYLDNYSIAALAESAGFNAQNSFYRIFKNNTDQTPSQYAELQKTIEA